MTKREAQARVDRGDLTWGHLKQWLQMAEADGRTVGLSDVNPGLTKRHSIDILTAGTAPREDNEMVIADHFPSRRNNIGFAIAVNVLREVGCGDV